MGPVAVKVGVKVPPVGVTVADSEGVNVRVGVRVRVGVSVAGRVLDGVSVIVGVLVIVQEGALVRMAS